MRAPPPLPIPQDANDVLSQKLLRKQRDAAVAAVVLAKPGMQPMASSSDDGDRFLTSPLGGFPQGSYGASSILSPSAKARSAAQPVVSSQSQEPPTISTSTMELGVGSSLVAAAATAAFPQRKSGSMSARSAQRRPRAGDSAPGQPGVMDEAVLVSPLRPTPIGKAFEYPNLVVDPPPYASFQAFSARGDPEELLGGSLEFGSVAAVSLEGVESHVVPGSTLGSLLVEASVFTQPEASEAAASSPPPPPSHSSISEKLSLL